MKSYVFKVVVEDDEFEDGRKAFHAYCPALESLGAATWGYTKEEALKNIREVVQMVIDELVQEGKEIPRTPSLPSSNLRLWWPPFENPARRFRPRIRPRTLGGRIHPNPHRREPPAF